MFKISKKNSNKVVVEYNTNNGYKSLVVDYKKPLFKNGNGGYKSLDNKINYIRSEKGKIYPYECFKSSNGYDRGLYFNTLLQLDDSVFDEVIFPNYVFYDIETNEHSKPITKETNDGVKFLSAPDTAMINSIAWIDKDDNEFCVVRGVDGDEFDILNKFHQYLTENNVTCLIGHINSEFDDILLRDRLRHYNIDNNLFKKSTNQNNLDTLELAKLFNYVDKNKKFGLNDLASLLNIGNGKLDLEELNPVTAYNKSVETGNFEKFIEYNLQDVRVTRDCFNRMDSKNILTNLFKLTKCPFNKMVSVVTMLNHYSCNLLWENKIIVPQINNPTIKYENSGGYNKPIEKNKLLKVDNVVCADIVSYYPHLFYLVHANNLYEYPNFNTDTGDLTYFDDNLEHGYLSKIAIGLYNERAKVKKEMKDTDDVVKKQQLNYQQMTYKILVNGLYGACDSDYNYILGSHLISTLITEIGRNLLKHLIEKFDCVYAKTDSIFLKITDDININNTLIDINNEVTDYLKEHYNLNNFKSDGNNIIRFEIDSTMKKLIVRSKSEYIKILDNDEIVYKGSVFTGDKSSSFEKDLTQFILKDNFDMKEVFKFCDDCIETKPLDYFNKKFKLSSKTPNQVDVIGYKYMEDNQIPYSWDFKYNGVRVESDKYDWILYPNGHKPEFKISKHYVYKLAIKYMEKTYMIDSKTSREYFKDSNLINGVSLNKYDKSKKDLITKVNTNTNLDVYKDKNNSTINNENKFNSIKLNKLCKLIPDTKEYATKELIKLLPLNNERKCKFNILKKHLDLSPESKINQREHIPQIPSGNLINGNDNVGVYVKYNDLCCLDIDGAKGVLNKSDNEKLVNYLKDLLVKTGVPFIIQKTQSNCYHLFYIGNNNFSFKGFKYPKDFFIKELAGNDLGTSTIEVLNNNIVPLAPTKTKTGKYEFISNEYSWEQIFKEPVVDMFKLVKDTFLDDGFSYTKFKEAKTNNRISSTNLIDLTELEIKDITKACIELIKIADTKSCKHSTALAMGGYFSRHISYKSAEEITYGIANECENLFRDPSKKFINTVLENYNSDIVEKTGLPMLINLLTTHTSTIEDTSIKNKINVQNTIAKENIDIITNILNKDIPHGYVKLGFNNSGNEYGFTNNKKDNTINYTTITEFENDKGEKKTFTNIGDELLLFCFDKIEIINGFNPKTQTLEDDNPTKYNFTIKSKRFKNLYKTYNNITLNQFVNKIENLDLTVYDGNLKDYIRKIINKYNSSNDIRNITKPYPTGVFCYNNEIMINCDYLNRKGSLEEGLTTLQELVNDVFLNKAEYITVLNITMLNMLSSVFKSCNIANGVNRVVILSGAGGTLKTFAILSGIALFDYYSNFYESTGGDSDSAIQRQLANDTLPLDIHDSKLDVSDRITKNMFKSLTFGFESQALANGQFGNDINIRDAYRLLMISLNDTPITFQIDKDDGEDRRLLIIFFGDSFKVNEDQIKAIQTLLNIDKDDLGHLRINKISSIGYCFLKYIQNIIKPYDLDPEFRNEIINTKGKIIIDMFWDYVNEKTDYKYRDLCNLMKTEFVDIDYSTDRNIQVIERLRYDFNLYTGTYDIHNQTMVEKWIEKSPLFVKIDNDKYKDKMGINKTEFKNLVKDISKTKTEDSLYKSLFEDCMNEYDNFKRRSIKGLDRGKDFSIIKESIVKKVFLGVLTD